jgi:hypothetical protein
MIDNRRWFAVVLVGGALLLGGCADTATSDSEGDPAATVEEVAGAAAPKVTLTDLAVERLQLTTAPVTAGAEGKGLRVPYAAVVYDTDGAAWVYTSPAKNAYVRSQVTITAIDGTVATLSAGPPAGTPVVTVGTAELLGAEAGLGA